MRAIIVWLLLCLIWGSTWLFIKLGLEDLPPFTFAGIRFFIAASILLLIVAARRTPFPRDWSDWRLMTTTGLLSFALNYGLLFWGGQYVSSGLAALLQAIIPAFGLVIAHHYLPNERITLAKICGVVLGIAGVGIIFSDQLRVEGTSALWGSAAIIVGALGVAYGNVLIKARGRHLDPATLAAVQMCFGFVPLLVIGSLTEGSPLKFHWTPTALLSLFYLALVGSALAFLLFYWLVKRVDVTKTMLIALVTPFLAVVLGRLVLNEQLTWRALAGGACIIAGVMLIVMRRGEREAKGGLQMARE
ncbi:MAG: EamA family transporter [Acidobacteriota bacterium]|nr:EamA family transporter [Acidobacteriota bacterium]